MGHGQPLTAPRRLADGVTDGTSDGLYSALVARGVAIHHVYSAILVDHIERNGLMSSIFAGSKFVACRRVIEARDGGIALDSFVSKKDVDESRAEALATALWTRE